MSRVAEYISKRERISAIQIVRNAIGEVYDFNDQRDLTVSIKKNKISGTLISPTGALLSFSGKDYLIKEESGEIYVLKPEVFAARYEAYTPGEEK